MEEWAKNLGRSLNMALAIKNSWDTKIYLWCALSGSYKLKKKGKSGDVVPNIKVGDDLKAKSYSRKIECPFELMGRRGPETHVWRLTVVCGRLNHELDILEGYAYVGRLTEEQKNDVKLLTLSNMEPKNPMTYLHEKWPGIITTMKQLYSAQHEFFKAEMGIMAVSQFVISYLQNNEYYFNYRTVEGGDEISDLFFVHPK